MAFAGTEVLEVAPTAAPLRVGYGGGYVFCVGGNKASILNTSTGVALLYDTPGNAWTSPIAYDGTMAWYSYGDSYYGKFYFGGITSTGLTKAATVPGDRYLYPAATALVCDGYVHAIQNSSQWYRLTVSTMTAASMGVGPIWAQPIMTAGVVGSTIYDPVGGTTLTAWNGARDTSGSSWSLPLAPISAGCTVGTKIWWQASGGMVWFDTATNTSGGVAATPGSAPSSGRKPAVLGDVAYWIHTDDTKMVAFNLVTGQWKLDDLATTRANRTGIGVGSGKLWIPSTVTPP